MNNKNYWNILYIFVQLLLVVLRVKGHLIWPWWLVLIPFEAFVVIYILGLISVTLSVIIKERNNG